MLPVLLKLAFAIVGSTSEYRMSVCNRLSSLGLFLLVTGTSAAVQHSWTLTGGDGSRETNGKFSSHANRAASHRSQRQIRAKLKSAKKRVALLESLLTASDREASRDAKQIPGSTTPGIIVSTTPTTTQIWETTTLNMAGRSPAAFGATTTAPLEEPIEGVWATTEHERIVKLVVLSTLFGLIALFAIVTIVSHDRNRTEYEPKWHHDPECLTKILLSGTINWMIFGVYCFTEIFVFNEEHRHLTTIEAVYVNSQIITSVGYGDFTPTSTRGTNFMTFYAITAVALFGILTQHMIMWYIEMTGDPKDHEHDLQKIFLPVVLCVVAGTLFYGAYPGEEKTYTESLYLSIITFLTVGFGDLSAETKAGKIFGSVWMIVGVTYTGKAIVDSTTVLFVHRKNLRNNKAASKAFDDLDRNHTGHIDKVQFLAFELVQEGLDPETIPTILQKFDEFNPEHDGHMTFEEFKRYVDSIPED